MTETTDHQNLAAALVAALKDVTTTPKTGKATEGQRGTRKFSDMADIVGATRPKLAEHGLVALTPVEEHGDGLKVTVVILHSSGERLEFGPLPFPAGRDAQATGSQITYHRRYALLSALGIAPDDDDDGATAKVSGGGGADARQATAPPPELEVDEVAPPEIHQLIRKIRDNLTAKQLAEHMKWWQENSLPPISKADRLTEAQAKFALDHLDGFPSDGGGGGDHAESPAPATPQDAVEPEDAPPPSDSGLFSSAFPGSTDDDTKEPLPTGGSPATARAALGATKTGRR